MVFYLARPLIIPEAHIYGDVDPQAIPPCWPPTPEALMGDQAQYELRAVPLTSISLVTNKTIKVS